MNEKKISIWSIGFRPFFLGGALFSALLISYWAIVYFKGVLPEGYFDPINWHAHEMIYGFAVAIIAGFLLTASANWTGTKPLSGKKLIVLFCFWFLGRVAFALSLWKLPVPPYIYCIIDMLFIPACIAFLAPSLIIAKKIKNIQFLFVLGLLSLGNLFMHFAALDILDFDFASKGVYLGVNLILLILIIISGRIVPFFTMNAMPHIKIKKNEIVDYLTIISVCAFIFLDFFEKESGYAAWAALCAFALNFVRMLGWKSWKLKGSPLLWILHLGYLWIVIGFLLVFLSDKFELLPRSVAIHAFTTGAMGTFIIGMMSRVSLGHTGRPLRLTKGFVISYFFITLSGIIRVGSTFFPDLYADGILLSGFCWVLSFVIFLAYYSSILISPRPDGKPG